MGQHGKTAMFLIVHVYLVHVHVITDVEQLIFKLQIHAFARLSSSVLPHRNICQMDNKLPLAFVETGKLRRSLTCLKKKHRKLPNTEHTVKRRCGNGRYCMYTLKIIQQRMYLRYFWPYSLRMKNWLIFSNYQFVLLQPRCTMMTDKIYELHTYFVIECQIDPERFSTNKRSSK